MKGPRDRLAPIPAAGWDRPIRRGGLWLLAGLLVYFSILATHPAWLFALGVAHYNVWFLDTFALLASNDAVSRGLDAYQANPLDYLSRPHVYSHWWLHLRDLGLTRADVWWLSLGIVTTFLATALYRLRPRTLGQLLWYAAVVGCPSVLLALDRANNDLVIFILLAPVVPCLLAGGRRATWLAPLLIAIAAALKYYPAAAVVVLWWGRDQREWRARWVVALLLLALAGWSVASDVARFPATAPLPEGLTNFGATGFFNELGWKGWGPKLLCGAVGLAIIGAHWRRRPLGDWEPETAQQSHWLHFTLGALLLTGCFFASMNFGYRWIFAVWLAPLLWDLPRAATTPVPVVRWARATQYLLFAVLWWAPFCCLVINRLIGVVSQGTIMRLAKISFLVEQPMDWALFFCLLAFLVHFVRRGLTSRLPGSAS